jgi:hypothetical protein
MPRERTPAGRRVDEETDGRLKLENAIELLWRSRDARAGLYSLRSPGRGVPAHPGDDPYREEG